MKIRNLLLLLVLALSAFAADNCIWNSDKTVADCGDYSVLVVHLDRVHIAQLNALLGLPLAVTQSINVFV